jgi:hypothetical protein
MYRDFENDQIINIGLVITLAFVHNTYSFGNDERVLWTINGIMSHRMLRLSSVAFYTTQKRFYCAPSGFNELRPARRISSVESRFTAITELK